LPNKKHKRVYGKGALSLNAVLLAAASDGRIFALDEQTLVSIGIQLLNACILAAVLAYMLYKPVRKFLSKRKEGIQAQFNRAEDRQMRADELKDQYAKKLRELESERVGIIEKAHEFAAEQRRQMLLDAEEEVIAMKKRAAADIQAQHERADEELRLHVIDVAGALAEKFVAHTIDQNTQNRLFHETIACLEDTAWKL